MKMQCTTVFLLRFFFFFSIFEEVLTQKSLVSTALPMAGDSGDIAGLKYRVLTYIYLKA